MQNPDAVSFFFFNTNVTIEIVRTLHKNKETKKERKITRNAMMF